MGEPELGYTSLPSLGPQHQDSVFSIPLCSMLVPAAPIPPTSDSSPPNLIP